MRALLPLLLLGLSLQGCNGAGNKGPIAVGVIGPQAAAAAIYNGATDGGLVRLDREGQVIAGAAARWAILDDGLDYIFRIDETAGLSARTVARRLRNALRQHRRDPEFGALGAVESVLPVTATVVEIRLSVPERDLLPILARPEFAVGARTAYRIAGGAGGKTVALDPVSGAAPPIRIRDDRPGRAVAGFQAGTTSLVLGGSFTDLPVARAANVAREALRFDPATGLFGFALRNAGLSSAVRTALSLAIDRDAIAAAIGAPRQAKATTIAGSVIESTIEDRRAAALALLQGQTPHIRVAMPAGPGARLLFALAAKSWAEVGIQAAMVGPDAPDADLVLTDLVAPPGTLATLACAVSAGCDPRDRLALINPPFIPIMAPVRWSLVASSLDLFTENGLAAHPLDQLRSQR